MSACGTIIYVGTEDGKKINIYIECYGWLVSE